MRKKDHFKISSKCRLLKDAIIEYGKDNFYLKLIIVFFDDDLIGYETEYIRKYNTLYPNGYNLREYGNFGTHTEESKKKISNSLLGKPGHHLLLGSKLTEEHKKKISISLKGRSVSETALKNMRDNHFHKNVIKYNSNGDILDKFDSCKSAAEAMFVTKSAISMVCNGKKKNC